MRFCESQTGAVLRFILMASLLLLATACQKNSDGGGRDGSLDIDNPDGSPPTPGGQGIALQAPRDVNGSSLNNLNQQAASAVTFQIEVGSGYSRTYTVWLSITDETGNSVTLSQPADPSGAAAIFSNVDLSVLQDGTLTVLAELTDGQGAVIESDSTQLPLDTTPPPLPLSFELVSEVVSTDPFQSRPADMVTLSNAHSALIRLSFGFDIDPASRYRIVISDGTELIQIAQIRGPSQATELEWRVDLRSLADGPLTLAGEARDRAGNSVIFAGEAVTKDTIIVPTTVPVIVGGPNNSQGVVNLLSADAATVLVSPSLESAPGDRFQLVISDGISSQAFALQDLPNPFGPVYFTGLDLRSLEDGTLDLSVRSLDINGNSTSSNLGQVLKDTFVAPILDVTPIGPSTLNQAAAFSVSFTAVRNAAAAEGDQLNLIIEDGVNTPLLLAATLDPGPGTQTIGPIDLSGLNEGILTVKAITLDAAGNTQELLLSNLIKDAVPPLPPVRVLVQATANNPRSYVNAQSQTDVTIAVMSADENDPGRMLKVRLTQGSLTLLLEQAVANGSYLVTFSGVDLSSWAEGPLNLSAWHEDTLGNVSTQVSGTALIDRIAAVPFGVIIPAGLGNVGNTIDPNNVTDVHFDFFFGPEAQGSDTVTATLTDGSTIVALPTASAPDGGGTLSITGVNATSLSDGGVVVSGTTQDLAGNVAPFGPFSFNKDTNPPSLPTAFRVAIGAQNDADKINLSNYLNTMLEVQWPSGITGNETATYTLTDPMGATVTFGPQNPPSGGGNITVGPFNTVSLQDGPITLSVQLAETSGNTVTGSGTPAEKDIVPPDAATDAHVAAGTGNPADIINLSNSTAAVISVTLGPGSLSTETVTVTLTDTLNVAISTQALHTPQGGGTLTFPPVDLQTLADGTVDLSISLIDPAGNTTTTAGTLALKDTVTVASPVAKVSSTAQNQDHYINGQSAAAVAVEVTVPGTYLGNETVIVELRDSASGVVTSSPQIAPAGGVMNFTGLDCSGLLDGVISISTIVTDSALNTSTHAGAGAIKDTVAPAPPIALFISSGVSNSQDQINLASSSNVSLHIDFAIAMEGTELLELTLTDSGSNTVDQSGLSVPFGGGLVTVSGFNSNTLVDGVIDVSGVLSDPAGNQSTFAGTSGSKDTVPATPPDTLNVPAGPDNPIHFININTVAAPVVEAVWSSGSESSNSLQLTLTGGATVLTVSGANVPAGAGTANFPGLDAQSFPEGLVSLSLLIIDDHGNEITVNGTSATKDTTPPSAPIYTRVEMTANNPQDFVNVSTVGSIAVDVSLAAGQGFSMSDTLFVSITDSSSATVNSSVANAGSNGGITSFSLNGSSLAEGPLTLQTTITDEAGNEATFAGTGATIDLTPPTPPGSLNVKSGTGNAQNIINNQNSGSVLLDVVWDATTTSSDSLVLTFTSSSGGMPVTVGPINPAGPGADVIGPFDVQSLPDGTVSITGLLTDESGNTVAVTGTSAILSTGAPMAPNDAYVASGANNPRDFINAASETSVMVDVEFDGSSIPGNTVSVTLSDGVNSVDSSTQMTAGGAETMVFAVDASGLNEGPVTVTVNVEDSSMSLTQFVGTAAAKDTVLPIVPNRAEVAATSQNPVHYINDQTKASATVEIDLSDASYVGGELVSIVLTDQGSVTRSAGPVPRSNMSSLVSFAGLDCTALADGPITMQVTITDAAQNAMTFAGAVATKDILAPIAPASLAIAAGSNNAADFINNRNQGSTQLAVTWDASMTGSESATFRLTDSASLDVDSASYTAIPNGGGPETVAFGASTSLADGAITLQVTLMDAAGNTTVSAGTPATKATVAPVGPSAVHVLAIPNVASQDIINAGNFTNFTVRAVFPGTSSASNTVIARLEDANSGLVQSASLSAPGGAANLDFSGLDATALDEGMLTLTVLVESPDQNLTTIVGGSVFPQGSGVYKDTILPGAPSTFEVAQTAQNPVHWINAATNSGATVTVTMPASYDGTESFIVNLSDTASTTLSTSSIAVPDGGGTASPMIDASSLLQGNLTLTVDVIDGGENSQTFTASVAPQKDTVLPDLSDAYSLGGFTFARNVIRTDNVASITIRTTWGAAVDGNDNIDLSLDDGVNAPLVTMASAPNSAGNADVTGIDASGLDDGLLSFMASATDAAGNVTTVGPLNISKKADNNSSRYAYSANETSGTVGIYLASDDGVLHPQGFALAGTQPVALATDYLARWLYVSNLGSDTLSVFSISNPKGLLQLVGDYTTGMQPTDVAVDCHGRFVFTADIASSTISSFSIDESTGAPTGAISNAAATVPARITLHENGLYAFVTSTAGNTISSHSIDQSTGALSTISSAACSTNPVDFAIHPNGLWGYAAVSTSNEIRAFDITTSGVITPGAAVAAATSPSAITIHPSGDWALVTHSGSSDIQVYSINSTTGALVSVGATVPAGTNPGDIAMSNSGLLAYVTSVGSAEALTFDFNPATGALTANTSATTQAGPRAITIAGGENPIGFVLRYAPVVNKVSADIAVHEINDTTGALTPVGSAISTGAMSDPLALIIHPSNQWIYTANNADNTVGAFSLDIDTGVVAALGLPISTAGLKPASMALDLSGRFLYVVNTDSNDLQAFSINQTTGALSAIGTPVSAGNGSNPIAVVAHPLGGFLFTANSGTDSMSVFSINAQTGIATATATGVAATNGVVPNDVRIHPTGQWLYLVSRGSGTIETYDIDSSTGALSFASSANQSGQPSAMVIDATGAYAYVVSKSTGSVQAYTINSTTGSLATIGAPMPAGSDSRSLAIDPRTDFLYVGDFASGGPSTINVFTINDATGVLTSSGSQAVNGMGTNALQLVVEVQ